MTYLTKSGINFIVNGSTFIPYGASSYDITGSTSAVDQKHTDALAMNHNFIRYINWLPHSATANSEFSSTYWNVIDYALNRCISDNLYALLDLSDIQGISDARGYTFGDTNNLALWQSVVTWLAARTNTVNARSYKTDDRIGIISIVGEAAGLSTSEAIRIYGAISGYFKAAGFTALIQSGGCAHEIFNAVMSISTIDCNSFHAYDSDVTDELTNFPICQTAANQYSKPWFIEEFGSAQNIGDIARANLFRRKITRGFKFGCAGFLFWNNDEGIGSTGFGVSSGTPETYSIVKKYAGVKEYTPRIPI